MIPSRGGSSVRQMRLAAITLLTTLLAAAWAAPASAERHTYTLRYGPVTMGAYDVKFPKPMVQTPGVTGDIVGMSVRSGHWSGFHIPPRRNALAQWM